MPWRVFPWDPHAKPGEPFSPNYVFPQQGSGRFDLAGKQVLYLAETAVHAVAEKLQKFRGQRIGARDLHESRHALAVVQCQISATPIADLCDPATLVQHGIAPDVVASREKSKTQSLALRLYQHGYRGLRWWSALSGDWHTVVLFLDKEPGIKYEQPEQLTLTHAALKEACALIGVML